MMTEEELIKKLPRTYQIFLAIEKEARGEKTDGTCLLSNKTRCEHHSQKGGDHC